MAAAQHKNIHPATDADVEAQLPSTPLFPRSVRPTATAAITVDFQSKHASNIKKPDYICCHSRCRYLCFFTTLTFILLSFLVVVAGVALYLIFRPKLPTYSIDRIQVSSYDINFNNITVHATFNVMVIAENPNKKIGIQYYEDGSELSVRYTGTRLFSGTMPKFYQGHRNKTVVTVAMRGEVTVGGEMMVALQREEGGPVKLELRGKVPVRAKVAVMWLWRITVKVTCGLEVNTPMLNNQISIRSSSCKFGLQL